MLMAPWQFLLAPLIGLLAVSRPATRREWATLAIATPLLLLAIGGASGGVFEQFVRAAGVVLAGWFVVLMALRPGPFLGRAAMAITAAAASLLLWAGRFGFGWSDIQANGASVMREALASRAVAAAQQGDAGAGLQQFLQQLADSASQVAPLFPAMLVLAAVAGLATAWHLYQRVATHPMLRGDGSFAGFRFSDQLVWVPALALAALMVPVAPGSPIAGIRMGAQNVLMVAGALYAVRGLAVFWTVGRYAPRAILIVLSFVAVVLAPFAISGLALLGLADSWVDFRRRVRPPPTGGVLR